MRRNGIFLGLGSNLGDRLEFLRRSVEELEKAGIRLVCRSSVYETEPLFVRDQPEFLNQACEVDTSLPPWDLLRICLDIEQFLGRQRTIPKGPRELDIDILFCGERLIEESRLVIPHPGVYARKFVLVPLAEIAPDFIDPRTGKSVQQLLRECEDTSQVRVYGGE